MNLRSLLVATALLAASATPALAQAAGDSHRGADASRQCHRDRRRGADRRRHRQCGHRGAESRSIARPISAPPARCQRASARRLARAPGDRGYDRRHQGGRGDAAGAHRGDQGDRASGRPRHRTSWRPWQGGQSQADLRSRHAGRPPGRLLHRRHADGRVAVRIPATAVSTSPSRLRTKGLPRRQNCASPALRSRPSRPPSCCATSNAATS